MAMTLTTPTRYADILKAAIAARPTFEAICDFNEKIYAMANYCDRVKESLERGRAIIASPEQLIAYYARYGYKHMHKLSRAFQALFGKVPTLHSKPIELIDWGCGQALASCVLVDYIRKHNINLGIERIHLIEPSQLALERGQEHLKALCQQEPMPDVLLLNAKAETILAEQIGNMSGVVHFTRGLKWAWNTKCI